MWNYLYSNLDVSISNSPDAHSWITSVDILDQAATQVDKPSLDILKCISLIQIFGSRTLIKTTKENIYAAFPYPNQKI